MRERSQSAESVETGEITAVTAAEKRRLAITLVGGLALGVVIGVLINEFVLEGYAIACIPVC